MWLNPNCQTFPNCQKYDNENEKEWWISSQILEREIIVKTKTKATKDAEEEL